MPTIFQANQLPTRAECWHDERIIVAGTTPVVTNIDSAQIFNVTSNVTAFADGDAFTHSVILKAGVYTFSVLGKSNNNRGKLDWYLDGVLFLAGQDWYSGGVVNNVILTGSVTVTIDGYHTLKGVTNGKNASSTGYGIFLSKYWFKQGAD